MGNLFSVLSTYTYDGEGEAAWHEHLHNFLSMIHQEDEFSDEQVSLLLAYTLHESPHWWLCSLPTDIVQSLEHLCDFIEVTFYHFDPENLDKQLLQQWKAPHDSTLDFW